MSEHAARDNQVSASGIHGTINSSALCAARNTKAPADWISAVPPAPVICRGSRRQLSTSPAIRSALGSRSGRRSVLPATPSGDDRPRRHSPRSRPPHRRRRRETSPAEPRSIPLRDVRGTECAPRALRAAGSSATARLGAPSPARPRFPGASQRREPRPAAPAAWGILTSPTNSRLAKGEGVGGEVPSSIRARPPFSAARDIHAGADTSIPRPSRSSLRETCPRQASQVSRWADTMIASGAGRSPVA